MILDQIIEHKKEEVKAAQRVVPIEILEEKCLIAGPSRPFSANLKNHGKVSLIAEIKKASPSKGIIRHGPFLPSVIAGIYEESGASAISVLTDQKYFQGSNEYLVEAKKSTSLPVLRKDFVVDAYQIYEAKSIGADAVLLIMSALPVLQAEEFLKLSAELGLEALVEVHTEKELEQALKIGAKIIGINNRNLHDFKTDLRTTVHLSKMINDEDVTIVSESGINNRTDVELLLKSGIHAMLVGEAIMREEDIKGKILELQGERYENKNMRYKRS